MPFFSIVIVNYNYGRYLAQGIQSLLDQDFPAGEREIIVVDDGSTDDSVKIIESFGDKVVLLRQQNQKQAGAFKTGFAAAKGQVLCLLDADDYCHPEKLKAMAEAFKDPKVGVVQHYLRDVDVASNPLKNHLPNWPARYTLADLIDGRCEDAATSGLAFRREVLDRLLPVPDSVFCFYDEYLIYHALFFTEMANIPRILGYHRMHGSNNWAQRNAHPEQLERHVREFRMLNRLVEEKLRAQGLSFTPRYKQLEQLEYAKREILMHMHRGERRKAFALWRGLFRSLGGTPLGFFRSATLLLALLSPGLYLRFYAFYSDNAWLSRLREGTLPSPR